MAFYRIKQFYWSLSAKIEKEDIEFINQYLNGKEREVFKNLSIAEKKHSINVAKEIQRICNSKKINDKALIKVGLLHDIGKSVKRLTIIDKSIMVLLDKFTKGKIKRIKGIEKINVYYNHGELGAALLKSYEYDERILFLIENHHNPDICGDEELNILKQGDNNS